MSLNYFWAPINNLIIHQFNNLLNMHPTNDPELQSFIEVEPESHFPIQNLPYGVAHPKDGGELFICTAIGEQVVNLTELEAAGVFDGPELDGKRVFSQTTLNSFMELGSKAWSEARSYISNLLSADEPALRDNTPLRERVFTPMDDVEMLLPVDIGDYFLFLRAARHQCRQHVSRSRKCLETQLETSAGWLSREGKLGGCKRNRSSSTAGTNFAVGQ